jgi:hypothetical protein
MLTLGIDPGNDTGWAIVTARGQLLACGLGAPPHPSTLHPEGVSKVIIEKPQVYQGRSSKGDPNDLIKLAIGVGRYLERYCMYSTETVLPREWKGTVDPDVLCRRVVKSLVSSERNILDRAIASLARAKLSEDTLTSGKRHNVIDAVGLAKWSVGSRLVARFPIVGLAAEA